MHTAAASLETVERALGDLLIGTDTSAPGLSISKSPLRISISREEMPSSIEPLCLLGLEVSTEPVAASTDGSEGKVKEKEVTWASTEKEAIAAAYNPQIILWLFVLVWGEIGGKGRGRGL